MPALATRVTSHNPQDPRRAIRTVRNTISGVGEGDLVPLWTLFLRNNKGEFGPNLAGSEGEYHGHAGLTTGPTCGPRDQKLLSQDLISHTIAWVRSAPWVWVWVWASDAVTRGGQQYPRPCESRPRVAVVGICGQYLWSAFPALLSSARWGGHISLQAVGEC